MIRKGLAGIFACILTTAAAAAADRAIIVLDASGSMWGQIDGRPKLEIARETLGTVLSGMPGDLELGLMAYGHREKGNCADIELVVPPARGTVDAIVEAAGRMRFLGKTPLSEAVRQAAEALRYGEEKATVIVITDGIETCNADPCALAGELERSGVDFTAHVVGFGLSREEGRQVACLAENTGGRYIQARNASELSQALTVTVAPPPPEPAKPQQVPLPAATVATADEPSIGQSIAVSWTGPGAPNDYVDIVPAGFAETGGELSYAYVDRGSPLEIRAPGKPGSYDIRYVWEGPDRRHVLALARVDVHDSEVALMAPASVPVGQLFDVGWKGPGQPGDYVDIVPAGHAELSGELSYVYVEQGNPARIRAPRDVGAYQLRYLLDAPDGRRLLVSVPLDITEANATLAFPPSVVAGTPIDVSWTGPAGPGDYIDVVPEGHREPSGEIAYSYVENSPDGETVAFKAPGEAGRFQVRYVLEAADGRRVLASEPISVTAASATLRFPEAVETGTEFKVEWTGPGASGDYVDLVPAGHGSPDGEIDYFYVDGEAEKSGTLTAPGEAGDFEVRYVLDAPDGRRVLASVPLAVQ